ncbi:hypothetical protein LguiA_007040 [Lonicera macranthoides]
MKMFGHFSFRLFFLGFLAVTAVVVYAQDDQSGFISIDCGIPEGSNYTDAITGIQYVSDKGFIDTGLSRTTSPEFEVNEIRVQRLLTLRSFPQGTRNCYNLRPAKGKGDRYLIRARFFYGNYDRKNQLPEFDMHLGVEHWDTITFDEVSTSMRYEIIHIPTSDYINICFINTGYGTPFVSSLELRPLSDAIYKTKSGSLDFWHRWDLGSLTDKYVRYKDDSYDRIWKPQDSPNTTILSTSLEIDDNNFKVPSKVMKTAIMPQNASDSLQFSWEPKNETDQFYIYMHFAEVEALQPNQSRSFNIYLNGELWYGPFSPRNLSAITIHNQSPANCNGNFECQMTINRTDNSTLPPIINALELYQVIQFTEPETDENDLDAITNIKATYGVTRNWQGDPCAPKDYVWDGLNCTYDGFSATRIISLNLSSSGLTGEIAVHIYDLKIIQSLDLSNNSLTGQVPDFLSQLASLRVLKLNGNNFTGSVPAELLKKSENGLLSLSVDGLDNNTNPSQSVPHKKKTPVVPIVASVASVSLVLLAAILIFLWVVKKRKQRVIKRVEAESNENSNTLETKNRQFTYSEVLSMTNNFQRVIGKGGFGTVYHGYDGATQVAVKMLSPSSIQGYKEFQAEASLLMNIHHKNLTSLVGYCNEGTNIGIIYEYMANGNLDKLLSDRNLYVMGWEERLRIAIDASQGLEYLHHGCKPPIAHRDVKSTNILLSENFHAKLSDFGLSRVFPIEGDTHVSTIVAGTPGYLDPEYSTSNRLTEKSDVYAFGIVLLEIVAGRPAIAKSQDRTHIIQWVSATVQKGDIKHIVDPRLRGEFDVNSVWKVVELAMACVSRTSTKRPTMDYVVMELKECLAAEIAKHADSKNSVRLISMNLDSGMGPRAR